jgi:hypothetical protein
MDPSKAQSFFVRFFKPEIRIGCTFSTDEQPGFLLGGVMTLSIDFLKPFWTYHSGNPGAFGLPEAGGSFGFATFTIEKHSYWFIPLSFVVGIS